jgi:hypothetical protein
VALRVTAIRAAAMSGAPSVRDWLLSKVLTRSTFLRRAVLAKPSLINATALNALQRHYANDPVVAPALALGQGVKSDAQWRSPTQPSVPVVTR